MNPRAIVWWLLLTIVGALIGHGAFAAPVIGGACGLAFGLALSLWAEHTS